MSSRNKHSPFISISLWGQMKSLKTLSLMLLLAIGGCGSLPEAPERTPSYALEDTSDTTLARDLEPLITANAGLSGFKTLRTGEDAFMARLKLIKVAERSIDVQYYIWHDDLTGGVVYNRLLGAADRGVRVRLLLDDMDTSGKDEMLRMIDSHPNVEVRLFNPFIDRDHRVGDLITDTVRINHRMHNKTLTADNQATIFGGRNIGDEYFAATESVGFGDLDALGVGPIAKEVSAQFDLYWNSDMVYPLAAFDWKESLSKEAIARFRSDSDAMIAEAMDGRYVEILSQLYSGRVESIAQVPFIWSPGVLVFDHPEKLENEEMSMDTHLAPKLKEGFARSTRDLIIVSPYFVPGKVFTRYLVETVERGVRVRILTNSLQANDVALVHAGYMRYRKDLISGGIELYEFKADAAKERNEEKSRIDVSKSSLHAKFFVFDEDFLFIGSFNLDPRSILINTELGVFYRSPKEAKALSETFDSNALRFAYRVELDEKGDLQWVTLHEGEELRLDKEPDTTWWKRFSTGVLSPIVPESQL
jgi:putative cardiolipin synthase